PPRPGPVLLTRNMELPSRTVPQLDRPAIDWGERLAIPAESNEPIAIALEHESRRRLRFAVGRPGHQTGVKDQQQREGSHEIVLVEGGFLSERLSYPLSAPATRGLSSHLTASLRKSENERTRRLRGDLRTGRR